MRKKYKRNFKHFFVCEFGKEHGRPHYHGILFGIKYVDFYEVESLWNRGNGIIRPESKSLVGFFKKPRGTVYLGYAKEDTCHYLVKYLTKEPDSDYPIPRVMSSKGIGSSYLDSFTRSIHNGPIKMPFISYKNYLIPLSQFYRRRLYSKEDKIELVKQMHSKPRQYNLNGNIYFDKISYWKALDAYYSRQVSSGLSYSSSQKPIGTRKRGKRKNLLQQHWLHPFFMSYPPFDRLEKTLFNFQNLFVYAEDK